MPDAPTPPAPTVFVVDDDPAVRAALQVLIRSAGRVVETFGSAREFLEAFNPSRPGCVVLDLRMPGMSGIELQEALSARGATIPVIMVTAHGEIWSAVRAMKAGAIDFIEKPYGDQTLLDRIEQAIARDAETRRASCVRQAFASRRASLTPRDREVMDRLIAGRTTKQIAAELGVSTQAIDAHRKNILQKMQVESIVELVRLATSCEGPTNGTN